MRVNVIEHLTFNQLYKELKELCEEYKQPEPYILFQGRVWEIKCAQEFTNKRIIVHMATADNKEP